MKTAQELSEEMKQTAKDTLLYMINDDDCKNVSLFVESIVAACTLEIGLIMKEALDKSKE